MVPATGKVLFSIVRLFIFIFFDNRLNILIKISGNFLIFHISNQITKNSRCFFCLFSFLNFPPLIPLFKTDDSNQIFRISIYKNYSSLQFIYFLSAEIILSFDPPFASLPHNNTVHNLHFPNKLPAYLPEHIFSNDDLHSFHALLPEMFA